MIGLRPNDMSFREKLLDFFCSGIQLYVLLSPYLSCVPFSYLDLYVLGDDTSIS